MQPEFKPSTENGMLQARPSTPSKSRCQSTRTTVTPAVSPQQRRTDRITPTASRSTSTTPASSPRTLRRGTNPYYRTITKTLPLLPDSTRSRGYGVGPFTTVYRNRFGAYTRVTSSPPTRARLVTPSSPVLLRTPSSRSTFTRGRLSPLTPNQMRLYHIACATASSAAKQRPPVRPRLPPPPVPFPPPPPPPPKPRPTFASHTQSSAAKQVAAVSRHATAQSLSAASTRSGSPVQPACSIGGRARNRQPCRTSSVSLTSLSSRTTQLPRSPAPSPTPVRRSETFTRKAATPTASGCAVHDKPVHASSTRTSSLTRSRTFSKDDRVEIVKRDSSPRVFKAKSPSPAQSPERTPTPRTPPTLKVTSTTPATSPVPSVPRSVRGKQKTARPKDVVTSPRPSSGHVCEDNGSPLPKTKTDDGNEINGSEDADDSVASVVANGSPRRTSKTQFLPATSNAENATAHSPAAGPKTSRSIMVQTTDI
ncbi:uncharacterized protein LOC144169264 [Haemaphysalis longicornis]